MSENENSAKSADVVDTIERFFFNLIGTVIPGGLLLSGWLLLFSTPRLPRVDALISSAMTPWLLLAFAYVAGHFVTGLGTLMTSAMGKIPIRFFQVEKKVMRKIAATDTFKAFVVQALQQFPGAGSSTDVRS